MLLVLSTMIVVGMCSFNSKLSRASWYGPGFNGRLTANGEVYNQNCLTSASPYLPFNTLVEVTNIRNNKKIIVRINDRGPFEKKEGNSIPHSKRALDLSKASFNSIANLDRGVINIKYKILN